MFAVAENIKQWYEEFTNQQQVIITHGLSWIPIARILIDDGDPAYDYILAMAEIIINSTTITVNFAPYTVSGRITYE